MLAVQSRAKQVMDVKFAAIMALRTCDALAVHRGSRLQYDVVAAMARQGEFLRNVLRACYSEAPFLQVGELLSYQSAGMRSVQDAGYGMYLWISTVNHPLSYG
jgi:hypothetical protein